MRSNKVSAMTGPIGNSASDEIAGIQVAPQQRPRPSLVRS
jgi:hypothetical protein